MLGGNRKIEVVVAPANFGRDAGKHFKITEWPAARAEKWAWRASIALKGTTAQIPRDIERLGMVGVARFFLNAYLAADIDVDRLMPLLDEMMTCVEIIRVPGTKDPANPQYPLSEPMFGQDDVSEVRTIGWLRSEVIRIHTNFSPAAALSELISAIRLPETNSSTT